MARCSPGNMYYLDPNIIRPLTAGVKLSFSELIGPDQVGKTWRLVMLGAKLPSHIPMHVVKTMAMFTDWEWLSL